MKLSEMYWYYRKTDEDNGKEMVDLIRKREDWHKHFRGKFSKENIKEDNSEDDNEYDDK